MEELDQLQKNIGAIRDAVSGEDEATLRRLLQTAAQIKRQYG